MSQGGVKRHKHSREKQLNPIIKINYFSKPVKQRPRRIKEQTLRRIKEQTEMNNIITEMKTTLEGIYSRITEAEEWKSDLEDRMLEITATEQNKEKRMKKNEDSLRELWDNIKRNNIPIIGVPEGEESERTGENI